MKGTYEERIFHAVMQRDQWFQVLIGSKRKEQGQRDDDEATRKAEDVDDPPVDVLDEPGGLTQEEKDSVMINLKPTYVQPLPTRFLLVITADARCDLSRTTRASRYAAARRSCAP